MRPPRLRRGPASAALAFLALAAAACESPRRPNVLWIVWDTVRADRMSLYGHGRETTPEVDRWAAGARVFDDCLSTAGYTLPSHGAMFTGLLPSEHCANNDYRRLDERYTTLPELLRAAGYRSYLYSANPHISAPGGFDQGFDRVEHPWSPRFHARAMQLIHDKLSAEDHSSELPPTFRRLARSGGRMSIWNLKATGLLAEEAVVAWLESEPDERPFFVFLNYMEAHRPLIPPRRYRERMMSPERVERSYEVDRAWTPTWEYTFGLRDYDDEAIELTRATYDAALAELDDLFGRLIETLERRGHLDDTIVVLTSDHGEHLGEQHMLDHQYSVYQPLLDVPLVVHYPPRVAPGRDDRPVANFDLFPTLLELTGVEGPSASAPRAVSLLGPESVRARFAEDPAPATVPIATIKPSHPDWDPSPWQRELRALIEGGHKLIWGSDGRYELYDLAADPLERHDLVDRRDERAAAMRRAVEAYHESLRLCEPAGEPPPELTPAQIERLKALGYLGG